MDERVAAYEAEIEKPWIPQGVTLGERPEFFEQVDGPSAYRQVAFFVPTTPIAQGNHRVNRHGKIYDSSGSALKAWRDAITLVAASMWMGPPLEGAVGVTVEFYMPRPKSPARRWPSVRPDLDKLVRAAFDGLTTAGIWRDDGQVVDLRAREFYADLDREIGARFWVGEFK